MSHTALQVTHVLRMQFRVSTNAYQTGPGKLVSIPVVNIAGIVSPDPPQEMHLDSEGQPLRWLRTDKAIQILRRLETEKVKSII